ncbi:MAG: acyltransferase family protein, partial [Polaromonas sp.]|nr:acyltransferase family protein [Polaromonas sp.]
MPGQTGSIHALKGLACTLIIWHHLAAYGPMSDVVQSAAPRLIPWLYHYARMAVQVFLVVGGFLSAGALTRHGQTGSTDTPRPVHISVLRRISQRFARLAPAYWVALLVSVAIAAAVRPWFDHPSVPAAPTWRQVGAHVFMLQDLLGQPALSAGIWYVAIDLQLYAVAALVFGLVRRSESRPASTRRRAGAATLALTAMSLLAFNRQSVLDITALYFFGAYGLGMLAFWTTQLTSPRERLLWEGLLTLTWGAALWVDFRARIALAGGVALALIWLQCQSLALAGWWSEA